jgi:dihydroceramidase
MTGVGAYFYIAWGIWLRYCLDGRQDDVKLVWPRLLTSFPEVVVLSPEEKASRLMNGEAKKIK